MNHTKYIGSPRYDLQASLEMISVFAEMESWGAKQLGQVAELCKSPSLLVHEKEERTHARMLKSWSLVLKREASEEVLHKLLGIGRLYLNKIKVSVLRALRTILDKSKRTYYGYVIISYLIEVRAVCVYRDLLEGICTSGGDAAVLKRILDDEVEHLNYLRDELLNLPEIVSNKVDEFLQLENDFFLLFLKDTKNCLTFC